MDLSGLSRANMEPSLRMAPSPWTQQPRNHLWLVFHPHPPYLNGYLLSLSQMHPAFFVSTISTVLVQGIMAISHQDKCNHVLTALALPPTPPPLSTLQPEWSRDNANLRGTPSHYILQWLFNSFGLKIKKKKNLKMVYKALHGLAFSSSPAASSTMFSTVSTTYFCICCSFCVEISRQFQVPPFLFHLGMFYFIFWDQENLLGKGSFSIMYISFMSSLTAVNLNLFL